MTKHEESDMIPVRRPITGLTADNVASVLYTNLIAQWGLTNATKVGKALADKLKGEAKRRKGKK